MKQIIVRDAAAGDYPAALALMRQVHALHARNRPDIYLHDDVPLTAADYMEMLRDPAQTVLLALVDGAPAGLCLARLRQGAQTPSLRPCGVFLIEAVCVDAAFRRQGVGRRLVRAALSRGEKSGAQSAELMVWSFNAPACAFYESLGFAPRSITMEAPLARGGAEKEEPT